MNTADEQLARVLRDAAAAITGALLAKPLPVLPWAVALEIARLRQRLGVAPAKLTKPGSRR